MIPTAPNLRAANIKQKAMTKEINIRWIACFLSNSTFDGLRLVLLVFLFAMLLLYHISETSREIKKMTASTKHNHLSLIFLNFLFYMIFQQPCLTTSSKI